MHPSATTPVTARQAENMRYKTIIRLVLRVMGIYFVFEGLFALLTQIGWALQFGSLSFSFVGGLFACIVQMSAGLYLFYGGKWVLDKVIPANRPYCPECAYDLT